MHTLNPVASVPPAVTLVTKLGGPCQPTDGAATTITQPAELSKNYIVGRPNKKRNTETPPTSLQLAQEGSPEGSPGRVPALSHPTSPQSSSELERCSVAVPGLFALTLEDSSDLTVSARTDKTNILVRNEKNE